MHQSVEQQAGALFRKLLNTGDKPAESNKDGATLAKSRGGVNALWYCVNQQFSECSRRSLLPNLPCEYRLELFKLPWQRARLLSPVPNSLNRPNLSPLFYAHFSLFLSMEGTRSAHRLHA